VRGLSVALIASFLAACSFTVAGPDPIRPRSKAPACDRSADGRMVLDTGPALAGIVGTVLATVLVVRLELHNARSDSDSAAHAPTTIIVVPAVIGSLYTWALVHNVRATGACRRAWTAHDEWRREQRPQDFADECGGLFAAWRAERDLTRRTRHWDAMPARCRQTVSSQK
jgi:hypothetical protein